MNPHFKIVIPKPCNEDWDKMTQDATGRFCLACNKSVIDFSNKMPEEIQHFFLKNQDKEICGRFKNSQLDAVSIQIPSRVLFSQTQYHKIFLLALFVVMGTSLFSCAAVNGDKQKIEKVEVVEYNKKDNNNSIPITDDVLLKMIQNDTIQIEPQYGQHSMGPSYRGMLRIGKEKINSESQNESN